MRSGLLILLVGCASITVAGILVAGCSSITDRPIFDETQLTPLDVGISAIPPLDNGEAARDAVLRITFLDDGEYPDPDTAVFGPILLRSGTATFDVTMHVSLVDHAIDVKPRSLLVPDTHYELVLGADLRSLSGRTLGTSLSADISVGNAVASPSPSPSPQYIWDTTNDCGSPGAGDVRCIFNSCAPACHTTSGCMDTRNPTVSLDIAPADSSGNPVPPTDPMTGLIGVPSAELAGTDHPLLRVQPFDSANSVLLRKLIGADPHADSSDPRTANLGIPGRRMPEPGAPAASSPATPARTA
jgi:hypothetical protein